MSTVHNSRWFISFSLIKSLNLFMQSVCKKQGQKINIILSFPKMYHTWGLSLKTASKHGAFWFQVIPMVKVLTPCTNTQVHGLSWFFCGTIIWHVGHFFLTLLRSAYCSSTSRLYNVTVGVAQSTSVPAPGNPVIN